jgi:hypothetical protein
MINLQQDLNNVDRFNYTTIKLEKNTAPEKRRFDSILKTFLLRYYYAKP